MTRNAELAKELSHMKIDQIFMFAVPDLPRLDHLGPVFYRWKENRIFSGHCPFSCEEMYLELA